MTDEELIEAMARGMCFAERGCCSTDRDHLCKQECQAPVSILAESSYPVQAHAALSLAKREIERRVVEELMNPDMEAKLAGAETVNAHMRGPGAPADYDAATDTWQAMLRTSPLYARVHGSEKGEG